MPTLYRQYRPQNFSGILGQNYIKTIIQNEIASGKVAQAYLFCGPRAVGKTTMARVLAKAVNCEQRPDGQYEPCNECSNCHDINLGRHLDITEIDAASNTGVDHVRENIINFSRVAPGKGKYKVFIIDEVHMLSISAFNALLKTLEEPPVGVIFILCTTEIHKVPLTIISRCQRFDFKRIGLVDMVKKLEYIVDQEKIKVEAGILEAIARQADGYLRDAESILGQIISIGGQEITKSEADLVLPRSALNEVLELLEYLTKKDAAGGIKLVNQLVDSGVNLKVFSIDSIEILRKMLVTKFSPGLAENLGLDYGENLEMKITGLSQKLNAEQISRFIYRFLTALEELKNSFILQLPLELAVVDLCGSNPLSGSVLSGPDSKSALAATEPKAKVEPERKHSDFNLSLAETEAKWGEVVAKIKPLNHSLSFLLQSCQVKGIINGILLLTFKYKFHKDRILSEGTKLSLEPTLEQVYGESLIIQAEIDEGLEVKNDLTGMGNTNLLNNLLKTFGGEVVN